jgi:hypothetical protein
MTASRPGAGLVGVRVPVMSLCVTYAPTLLLYLGAVLTGWAGGGWSALPPLWLAFLLWHVVMRPAEWPRDPARWSPRRSLAVGLSALALLAVAGFCLAVGAGLARLWALPLPVWGGVALAVLATPLQRWRHDPTHDARMAAFLDEALTGITNAPRPPDSTERAVAALRLALSRGETDLEHLSDLHSPGRLLDELARLRADHPLPLPLARALIDWACDPARSLALQGQEAPHQALMMVQEDAALVAHFARACVTLLRADPEAFWDCPSNRTLRGIEHRHANTAARAALRDLRRVQIGLVRARLARDRAEWLALSGESADNPTP